jgi:hypothetical protein
MPREIDLVTNDDERGSSFLFEWSACLFTSVSLGQSMLARHRGRRQLVEITDWCIGGSQQDHRSTNARSIRATDRLLVTARHIDVKCHKQSLYGRGQSNGLALTIAGGSERGERLEID